MGGRPRERERELADAIQAAKAGMRRERVIGIKAAAHAAAYVA